MEHVVQFGICIDDERIRAAIEKSAEEKIMKELTRQIMNHVFDGGYYGQGAKPSDPLQQWCVKYFDDFLAQNREVILDRAAERLADRMSRTKAAKEMLAQAVHGNKENANE